MTELSHQTKPASNPLRDQRKILVLEDEPMILTDLAMEVEDHDMVALTATTPQSAMDIIDSQHISGAVLDVNLGRGQTCEEVASRLEEGGIPFILHSGDLVRTGELVERLKAPIVRKPTPSCEVIKTIKSLLN